jgi:hypothetical protein
MRASENILSGTTPYHHPLRQSMHGGLNKHGNVIAIGGSVSPHQNMFVHNAAATQAEQERLFS